MSWQEYQTSHLFQVTRKLLPIIACWNKWNSWEEVAFTCKFMYSSLSTLLPRRFCLLPTGYTNRDRGERRTWHGWDWRVAHQRGLQRDAVNYHQVSSKYSYSLSILDRHLSKSINNDKLWCTIWLKLWPKWSERYNTVKYIINFRGPLI